MTLFQNPVFLTQRRLAHRSSMLLAVTLTTLLGFSLLGGLIYHFTDPKALSLGSTQQAGRVFYAWLLAVEAVLLVVGGFNRISRALTDERRAGLWDSNRLTLLPPSQLVLGYWFGAALREFYLSTVLALLGLVIVVVSGLPLALWLGTQVLLFGTALFAGLLGLAAGLAYQRPQGGMLLLFLCLLVQLFSLFQPRFLITNFLVPIYAVVHAFGSNAAWNDLPEVFGFKVHPLLYSLGLQFVVGWFLWCAVVRKTANPFQSLFRCPEASALFGVLVIAQHGLIWGLWRGRFGEAQLPDDTGLLLPIAQGGTLLAGALLLLLATPVPERVRVETLQARFRTLRNVYSCSAALTALALTAVAAAALFTQCALSLATSWRAYIVAAGNVLAFFAIFSLGLEFCRLRFQRRSRRFFVLGMSLVCLLPFVPAAAFANAAWCRLSLLSPGILALAQPADRTLNSLLFIVAGHLAIAILLFILWRNRWQTQLQRNPV